MLKHRMSVISDILTAGYLLLLTSCTPSIDFVYTSNRVSNTDPFVTQTSIDVETSDPNKLYFDGLRALVHAGEQVKIGPRPTGSAGSLQTSEYIMNILTEYGWTVEIQQFEYKGVQARNILSQRPPNGKPILLVGAHYDTRRFADQDLQSPTSPVLGANDGASGVAILLELARILAPESSGYDVKFVFFDAEDNGRIDGWEYAAGSRVFVDSMPFVPKYFILVDMVGDKDQQLFYEGNSDQELQRTLWNIADFLGYESYFVPVQRYTMLDDHVPFVERGIPAVDIIDFDYPYWHTAEDTMDKISAESLQRVGRVIEYFIRFP